MAETVKRVPVLDPDGNFGTVDEADAEAVTRSGGRVLTRQEVAAKDAADRYAAAPLVDKATSLVGLAAPVVGGAMAGVRGALGHNVAPTLPPELEAYLQGVSETMTGGLATVGVQEIARAAGGDQAAQAYAQNVRDAREGHEGVYHVGQAAGLAGTIAGGAAGAGKGLAAAVPGVGINAVGDVAEHVAAKALGGLAAKGVAGRALATAGELAARGAVEGALLSGAQQFSEDMLGDGEAAADKVFAAMGTGALMGGAGGAVLGGAGSLLKSGATAVAGKARGGLSRVLQGGAEALSEEGVQGAIRGQAQEQAWKAIGAGYGLQTTRYAKQAEKYLPNGTKDVGEVLMRKGVINAEGSVFDAVAKATPHEMLPRIETELANVGQRIGELTEASGGNVQAAKVIAAIDDLAKPYEASAATRPAGRSLRAFGADLLDSLGIKTASPEIAALESKVALAVQDGEHETADILRQQIAALRGPDTVRVQDLLRERKAIDRIAFGDATTMDPKLALELKRDLRSKLEGLVTESLDEASGKAKGELAAEYKALKRDFTALSIAADAAEDSAARASKGASLGLRDMLYGGGNIMASVGHKLVRERGNAAGAVFLSKMADMQGLTRTIAQMDQQVTRASRGLLEAPKPVKAAKGAPYRVSAEQTARTVAEVASNPAAYVDRVTRAVEGFSANAPNLAGNVTKRMTDAVAFLASKLPPQPPPDPFQPAPPVKMTPTQAYQFARYASYVEQPRRFFEEAERGQLTFEGAEVAKALMPSAFAEMQARTAEALAEMLARGVHVPLQQRQRLGLLLDFPAVPSQRPEHAAFLQANVQGEPAQDPQKPAASAPKRPLPTKTQQSEYDRLEAGDRS